MNRTFSAPVSLILAGEYSYQYGKPIVACGLDERVVIREGKKSKNSNDELGIVNEVLMFDKKKEAITIPPFSITAPTGFTDDYVRVVLIARFVRSFYFENKPMENLDSLVFKIEKKRQQSLSQIQSSAAIYGGLILYRKEFEFLKYLTRLNLNVPKSIEDNLYFVPLRKRNLFEKINKRVSEIYNRKPKFMETLFLNMEKSTKQMIISFATENRTLFDRSLNNFQDLIEQLDVVPGDVGKLCSQIRTVGGASKITYDGLTSPTEFLLVSLEKNKLERVLKESGMAFQKCKLARDGLRADSR